MPARKGFDLDCIEAFLQEKGIALYDMATVVRRLKDNASDKFLDVVEATDWRALLRRMPQCRAVVATGQKATDLFTASAMIAEPRMGGCTAFDFEGRTVRFYRMPSSSRAYPAGFAPEGRGLCLAFQAGRSLVDYCEAKLFAISVRCCVIEYKRVNKYSDVKTILILFVHLSRFLTNIFNSIYMKKFLLPFLFMGALIPVTAFASGKVYYASPDGSGDGSAYEKPCSFQSGISKISSGDTLYLLGGQYDLSARVNGRFKQVGNE